MALSKNINQNNVLDALSAQAGGRITRAIATASSRTGVDFAYLMTQANTESAFNPAAKARGSSARGLYQFIDSTWLQMVRDYGHKHGLGHYAEMIDARGRVDNPTARRQILALRQNPEKSALMAAEYASDNKDYLQRVLGADHEIGATEMYLAHFMGPGGAAAFLKAHDKSPNAVAAYIFPREARANSHVFYDRGIGRGRTLAEIYARFENKIGVDAPQTTPAPALVAQAETTESTPPPLPTRKPDFDVPRDTGFALSGSRHIDIDDLENYRFRNILAAREESDLMMPTHRITSSERFSGLRDSERVRITSEALLFAQQDRIQNG